MRKTRFHLQGLFSALLALMVQLGSGAVLPRIEPVTVGGVLCHSDDNTGGTPPQAPPHCLVCPLCGVSHARMAVLLPPDVVMVAASDGVLVRPELPPPSTAPPASRRVPNQPRAPPRFS